MAKKKTTLRTRPTFIEMNEKKPQAEKLTAADDKQTNSKDKARRAKARQGKARQGKSSQKSNQEERHKKDLRRETQEGFLII